MAHRNPAAFPLVNAVVWLSLAVTGRTAQHAPNSVPPVYPVKSVSVTSNAPAIGLCPMAPVTLHATVTGGSAPFTYSWSLDSMPFATTTAPDLPIAAADPQAHGGEFRVQVKGLGEVKKNAPPIQSAPLVLAFVAPPAISAQPDDVCVLPGAGASFAVAATGGGGLTYQWRKDGADILGEVLPSYTLGAVASTDVGTYDCVVTGPCESVTSEPASLTLIAFAVPLNVPVGNQPRAVLAADLSRPADGRIDIATANASAGTVTIRFNTGTGGQAAFATLKTITAFSFDEPRALVAGQFAGGPATDLAVACAGSGLVRVYNSDLNFAQAYILPLPNGTSRPIALAAADLDGDVNTDLLVAMEGQVFGGGGGAGIRLDGASAVSALPAPPLGFGALRGVAAGDFDLDGDVDAVFTASATLFGASTTDNVLLYENNGTGSLAYAGALSADANPRGITAADLDGDGALDLGVAVEGVPLGAPGGIAVFDNTGSGPLGPARFQPISLFPLGQEPIAIAAGDLGNDQGNVHPDDLVAANFGSGNLGIIANFDGESFTGGAATANAGVNPCSVAIADFDGDLLPDIVAANASSNDVSVLLALPPPPPPVSLALACPAAPVLRVAEVRGALRVAVMGRQPAAPALLLASARAELAGSGCFAPLAAPAVAVPLPPSGSGPTVVDLPLAARDAAAVQAAWLQVVEPGAGSSSAPYRLRFPVSLEP